MESKFKVFISKTHNRWQARRSVRVLKLFCKYWEPLLLPVLLSPHFLSELASEYQISTKLAEITSCYTANIHTSVTTLFSPPPTPSNKRRGPFWIFQPKPVKWVRIQGVWVSLWKTIKSKFKFFMDSSKLHNK